MFTISVMLSRIFIIFDGTVFSFCWICCFFDNAAEERLPVNHCKQLLSADVCSGFSCYLYLLSFVFVIANICILAFRDICNRECGDNNHDGLDFDVDVDLGVDVDIVVDVDVDAYIEPSHITQSSQNWCCEGFLINSSWFRSLLPTLSQVMFFHSHVSLFFWVVGLCWGVKHKRYFILHCIP